MFFDDLPKPKTDSQFPRNIIDLSISELEDYIMALETEISRVKDDILKKKSSQEAASSIFKS